MTRVNKILKNKDFIENINRNVKSECDREFCKHDITHCLDVARIAYIRNLEKGLGFGKEIIYAAALLHDIGKWKQYDDNIAHSIHSAKIAQNILPECGFDANEIKQIIEAILNHQNYDVIDDSFNYLIYTSDKISRKCYDCNAESQCNWSDEKKNYRLEV